MATGQLQLTLAIIKPDVSKIPVFVQAIRRRLQESGFLVLQDRQLALTRSRAEDFYSEHHGKFFHNRLVTFMSSGPIWAHVLARQDAISAWRRLLGPTKVYRAIYHQPECLRSRYGLTDTRNGFHGSDSPESAAREIAFFFPEFDVAQWFAQHQLSLRADHMTSLEEEAPTVAAGFYRVTSERVTSEVWEEPASCAADLRVSSRVVYAPSGDVPPTKDAVGDDDVTGAQRGVHV